MWGVGGSNFDRIDDLGGLSKDWCCGDPNRFVGVGFGRPGDTNELFFTEASV